MTGEIEKQDACLKLIEALDKHEDEFINKFIDHMPELLEIAENKRTVRKFFALVESKRKLLTWFSGILGGWIVFGDEVRDAWEYFWNFFDRDR